MSVEIRAVTDKKLIKDLKSERTDIHQLNSVILLRKDDKKILDLELPQDILAWVISNSVALIDEITPYNHQLYERNNLPVLIMFIDPKNKKNTEYLEIYKKVARKVTNFIKFVWADGTSAEYILKRRKLGLVSDNLPGIAFNLVTRNIYPYPEDLEITESNLDGFINDFIEGRPYVPHIKQESKTNNMPNCDNLSLEEFEAKALTEGFDTVFLVFSSVNDKNSDDISPIFNKLCKRLKELEYPYLRSFIIDIATQPVHKTVKIDKYPAVYLVPAYSKSPPYVHYTGKNELLSMMLFIEKFAEVKFKLPKFPHLSPNEVEGNIENSENNQKTEYF